jgi:hypothetical protein
MAFKIYKDIVKQHSLTWDEDTWQHAKLLSGKMGMSVSALMRLLVNKEWQQRQQDKRSAAA